MAYLESIRYIPHRAVVDCDGMTYLPVDNTSVVDGLPQIFWQDATPWREANLWAHERAGSREVDLQTIQTSMRHLYAYANFLEKSVLDWRHFPHTKSQRCLVRFRGALLDARDNETIRASTATARMRAVIQFYRFAAQNNLVDRSSPMWTDRLVVVRYFDNVGFQRTLHSLSTDLSIPNRRRPGLQLEDGLLPLSNRHMDELLAFANRHVSEELNLMLQTGFFTGARIQTIACLRVQTLERAVPDPAHEGIWRLSVGPSASPPVSTKFDVQGEILIPQPLLKALKDYAYSVRRLEREAKAAPADKNRVFLTRFGNSYAQRGSDASPAINREMSSLRKIALRSGLRFMRDFHFHVTRATYGTWLTQTALGVLDPVAAISLVRDAMLHKDETTTLKYIRFIERNKAKIAAANAFTTAFLGFCTNVGHAQ